MSTEDPNHDIIGYSFGGLTVENTWSVNPAYVVVCHTGGQRSVRRASDVRRRKELDAQYS